jgi:chromosome partitioning protein
MRDFLGRFPALAPHFDLCVIDTGPKWDELTLSALAVADAVIAPVQVAEDSVECAKMRAAQGRGGEGRAQDRFPRIATIDGQPVRPARNRQCKLAHAVGERLMFPAFIKARPTYKHAAENHRPVWMEGGGGAQAAAEEIRPILAEIERRLGSAPAAAT